MLRASSFRLAAPSLRGWSIDSGPPGFFFAAAASGGLPGRPSPAPDAAPGAAWASGGWRGHPGGRPTGQQRAPGRAAATGCRHRPGVGISCRCAAAIGGNMTAGMVNKDRQARIREPASKRTVEAAAGVPKAACFRFATFSFESEAGFSDPMGLPFPSGGSTWPPPPRCRRQRRPSTAVLPRGKIASNT